MFRLPVYEHPKQPTNSMGGPFLLHYRKELPPFSIQLAAPQSISRTPPAIHASDRSRDNSKGNVEAAPEFQYQLLRTVNEKPPMQKATSMGNDSPYFYCHSPMTALTFHGRKAHKGQNRRNRSLPRATMLNAIGPRMQEPSKSSPT